MNQELWDKILAYDLDSPFSEYGFSTRLANENYWTKNFTELAILEYKKFMYLAATADMMVSPSEIVDVVWHQHLIFTQSYQDFCDVIGKKVQHVPSTHNKEDFQKFRQAKERTWQFYKDIFGSQPPEVWDCDNMYDSLNLAKAKLKLRTFVNIGILAMTCLLIPFYILLQPVYVKIDNPYFVYGLIAIGIVAFGVLELFNRTMLKRITKSFNTNSFIFHLHPWEIIYLKTKKLENVINGTLNEILEKGWILVRKDGLIKPSGKSMDYKNDEETQAITTLNELGEAHYLPLLTRLKTKPVFANSTNCMEAFKKFFYKSQKFGRLFYINFSFLAILLLLAVTRIITGIVRDKPVFQMVLLTFLLILLIINFLNRLTQQVATTTIPRLYKDDILPARTIKDNWQWTYFLVGATVLVSSLSAIIPRRQAYANNSTDGGGASSCGSSCGSSCSSCGGCGGD